ncbi:MAG: endonuclease Q family protein [Candidatus Korarchaeota archaeon]|nr:endonuclease Q family protein [Candidatus Korarchaeota archaeon]
MRGTILRADLHIHSRYSRATSPRMDIPHLVSAARLKGVDLLGTGDFTHPGWMRELRSWLSRGESGDLYEYGGVLFLPQTEVNLQFRRGEKIHRIHVVVLAPSLEAAEQASEVASRWGDLAVDGRPTLSVEPAEFVEAIAEVDPWIEVIPAHAWTPWYSVFGSRSGFDSLEEAFGDQVVRIHAIETGLSSDPPMNWRLSSLDRYSLVSFSDAHSPSPLRLGRELTAFEVRAPEYREIVRAIRGEGTSRIAYTVEVPPEYGKYHYDGHRDCGVRLHPKEATRRGNTCPVCGRPLTLGVLHRVEELADRPEGYRPPDKRPFYSLIPLEELLAMANSRRALPDKPQVVYEALIREFGSELEALMSGDLERLRSIAGDLVAQSVRVMREGSLRIEPGYDGVYGKIIPPGETSRDPPDFEDLTDYLS